MNKHISVRQRTQDKADNVNQIRNNTPFPLPPKNEVCFCLIRYNRAFDYVNHAKMYSISKTNEGYQNI